MKRNKLAAAAVAILIATGQILAQSQHANNARGFDSTSAYQSHDMDHINLFNGNLVISIPLGQTYPVNGSLSYSFKLIYNSFIWSRERVCKGADIGAYSGQYWSITGTQHGQYCQPHSRPGGIGGYIVCSDDPSDINFEQPLIINDRITVRQPGDSDTCQSFTTINPANNAGVGWQVHLGKIYQPRTDLRDVTTVTTENLYEVYQSPDGNDHQFYKKLHEDDPAESPDIYYTRDSSYLRMWRNPNPSNESYGTSEYSYIIDFPNGEKHYFQRLRTQDAATLNGQTQYLAQYDNVLVRIEDQFNNSVWLNYFDDTSDPDTLLDNRWEVTDSVGRKHKFHFFKSGSATLINSVELETVNGATEFYNFNYAEQQETDISIPYALQSFGIPGYNENGSGKMLLPYLTAVVLPDGSRYSMPFATSYMPTIEAAGALAPGALIRMTLPTGGRLEWDHDKPDRNTDGGYGYFFSVGMSGRSYARLSPGIRKRRLYGADGTLLGTWKYDPLLGPLRDGCQMSSVSDPCGSFHIVNRVTEPTGDYTDHYFSVYPHPPFSSLQDNSRRALTDPHVADYGLPFSKDPRNANNPTIAPIDFDNSGKPLFISTIIYDASGAIKRKTYVRYEGDKYAFSTGFALPSGNNPRLAATRTVYVDDSNNHAEVQYLNFDGLGHYRQMTTYGNLGNDVRFETTQYNLARGTYVIDPVTNDRAAGFSYTPIPETSPWVLGTYEKQAVSQGSQRSVSWFNFNEKGQLLDKRIRKDFETPNEQFQLAAEDVLIHYDYDANGNVTAENYYGGSRQGGLNTFVAFPALAASASEYRIGFEHQCQKPGGATATIATVSMKKYLNASGAIVYKAADDVIDCSTGLPKASRDESGLTTQYTYGPMGRITYVKNQQGSYDQIAFQPHGVNGYNGLPKVTITRRPNGDLGSTSLSEEIYIYDGLGRLITEKRRLPGGVYQARQTTYNSKDWITSKSEWIEETSSAANKKTTYELFDPFGRATKITLPDNSVVWMTYKGVREMSRTVSVGTSISTAGVVSMQDSKTTEVYDRHGRLIMVTQPSGSGGQNGTFSYFYNVNGKIAVVSTADPSAGGQVQNRALSYDNLGNLLSESHPERSWAQYGQHDTMGNVGASHDGMRWLRYSHDRAARPTKVEELAGAWRTLKEFTYHAANGVAAGTFGKGKLASSIRHNFVLNPYEAHQNVAIGKIATQSSTYASSGAASIAVDGNTNGSYFANSVTHTNSQFQAWWQVDLGASYSLDQVNLWNRTDCCAERLSNFYVLVSDQPIVSTDLNTARNQSGVSSYYFAGQGGRPTTIPVGRTGRYVRVQLAGTNYLSLAEVEVIGTNPTIYDVSVIEEYMYSGLDGRVSFKKTRTTIPDTAVFEQSFAYDQLGNLAWQTYPKCTNPNCASSNTSPQRPWRINYGYSNGRLTKVGGGAGEGNTAETNYASSITYNINGTVGGVTHSNGLIDRQEMDLNYLQRFRRTCTYLPVANQPECYNASSETGPYSYDGAGNITKVGPDWYVYDKVGRVKEGTALLGTDPSKRLKQQYDYDGFGNRTQTRTYNSVSLLAATLKDTYDHNVNSTTNRLSLNYDAAGNLLGLPGAVPLYGYDALNMIVTAPGLTYLYGPDEERFWIINTWQNNVNEDNEETYTLRGLNNEVLREYKVIGGNGLHHWFWQKDYIYRGGALLAAETPAGVRHYHLDHLGSPRLITDAGRVAYERMHFLPFGENSGVYQNGEGWSLTYSGETVPTRLRFTGHEKDTDPVGLTYMHARHYWERSGKFMSIDPGRNWDPKQPQSWNMYSYVKNNPLGSLDPDGRKDAQVVPYATLSQAIKSRVEDARFRSAVQQIAKQGTMRRDGVEVTFTVQIKGAGTPTETRTITVNPVTNQYKQQSVKVDLSLGPVTDLAHTHDLNSGRNPSDPATGKSAKENDTTTGDTKRIFVWVVHQRGMTVYDPATKDAFLVFEGKEWKQYLDPKKPSPVP